MERENNRDPDRYLREIWSKEKSELARGKRGRLKIFLGYCAGVGKTYSMLEEADLSKKNGKIVAIGIVETHKRADTEEMTAGFEKIPLKKIEYSGLFLEEMDIDAVLARKPELVLVDELAHTNAAGSRHEKRFQDVEEFLNAGLNVFSTLNIQHIDSLNDVIYQLTGVKVGEVVPDSVIIKADEIELVDLTPEKLLERLHEGKVYVPEKAKVAMEKFFRKKNLAALRELSLNYTARRVEERSRTPEQEAMKFPWLLGSKLLVAISPSETSEKLIRYTSRIADDLKAEWCAVHIESLRQGGINGKLLQQLNKNLRLAKDLGGKVVNLSPGDVAEKLIRYSEENEVDMIVVGSSRRSRLEELFQGSVLNELVHRGGNVNIIVVGEKYKTDKMEIVKYHSGKEQLFRPYLASLLAIAVTAGFSWLLRSWINPESIGLLLILPAIVSGIIGGVRMGVFSSLAAVLVYDFFFVPPAFSFSVADAKYFPGFIIFIIIAVTISYLARVIRRQSEGYRFKDRYIAAINSFSAELLLAETQNEVLYKAVRKMRDAFGNEVAILLPEKNNKLKIRAATEKDPELSENDRAIAAWVFMNGKEAGRKTNTLSSSKWYFIPIRTKKIVTGVICLKPIANDNEFTQEQKTLLDSFINLITLTLTNLN